MHRTIFGQGHTQSRPLANLWTPALTGDGPLILATMHGSSHGSLAGCDRWLRACVCNFASSDRSIAATVPSCAMQDTHTGRNVCATLTLVARRSTARAGTRQWRRGADTQGARGCRAKGVTGQGKLGGPGQRRWGELGLRAFWGGEKGFFLPLH